MQDADFPICRGENPHKWRRRSNLTMARMSTIMGTATTIIMGMRTLMITMTVMETMTNHLRAHHHKSRAGCPVEAHIQK